MLATLARKYAAILSGLFTALVFCLRWRTCPPFSGQMPGIEDRDSLTAWGVYLIYAREPLGVPLGVVQGLSHPFSDEYDLLSRGPIALFAILFKTLGKLISAFETFYYFPLIEILSVFATGFFAARLVRMLGATSAWSQMLAAVFCGLSFPLLFRSSHYYYLTLFVVHIPFYLALACCIAAVARGHRRLRWLGLSVVIMLAALIDYYLLFGILVLIAGSLILWILKTWLRDSTHARQTARQLGLGVTAGLVLAYVSLELVGNFARFETESRKALMTDRYEDGWGYGGGLGGGFHVADLLAPIIPPYGGVDAPSWLQGGPAAYLVRLGWPLTTASLQDGQYEGFAYAGTIPILLAVGLIWRAARQYTHRYGMSLNLLGLHLRLGIGRLGQLNWPATLLIPVLGLFALSLGYVLHVGGIRVPLVPVPALYAAAAYPKLVFARALGRFDAPLVLTLLIGIAFWLDRATAEFRERRRRVAGLATCALVLLHVGEIYGYLVPPEPMPADVLVNELGPDRGALIDVAGTGPVIPVPSLRDNVAWGRICYALAYHTGRPLGGSVVGLGVAAAHRGAWARDRSAVLDGRVDDLAERYGDVLIAVSPDLLPRVLDRGGSRIQRVSLRTERVALFQLAEGVR